MRLLFVSVGLLLVLVACSAERIIVVATPTPGPTPTPIIIEKLVTAVPGPTSLPKATPILTNLSFDDLRDRASIISYDDLFRNNEIHVGELVFFEAEIIQVLEESTETYQLRANVTRGEYFWEDTVFLYYTGPRLLEQDQIEFVGRVEGLLTYEAVFGNEITIPQITITQATLIPNTSGADESSGSSSSTQTGPTPTPAPGFSRSNPSSVGNALTMTIENYLGKFDVSVRLVETKRGLEAWASILDSYQYNDPAPPGFEYLIAKIRFEIFEGPDQDTRYDLSSYEITAVSADGKEYESSFIVGPSPQRDANLYPGASHEGWVTFLVAENDPDPLMTLGRDLDGRGGVWWRLRDN